MDDRELEARLRGRLHERFDHGQPSPEVAAAVSQAFATRPARLRWASWRTPRLRLGWSLVALVATVVVVSSIYVGGSYTTGKPQVSATPAPSAVSATTRSFVLLPPTAALPSKASSTLATDVLAARLRALGFANFTSSGGFGIAFDLPTGEGPADDVVRGVLAATGDVKFVPLPASHYYGEKGLEATPGKPLPKSEPALFGWEGIDTVTLGVDSQERPALDVVLKPAARSAFADYTAAHVGEYMAIVLDGNVAAAPIIQAEIPGGEITISFAGKSDLPSDGAAAILVGGLLPEEWRGAEVPRTVTAEAAEAAAVHDYPGTSIDPPHLNVVQEGPRWRAVYDVTLHGEFPGECPLTISTEVPAESRCPVADSILVTVDAVTGAVISSEAPAP